MSFGHASLTLFTVKMRRDSIFYQLFQQYPALLFELLTNPPENVSEYTFDSKAVKEPRFEIDGVFVPPENQSPGVVYFCVSVHEVSRQTKRAEE